MKHLCASHFLYFTLFVFYFELIFCEIDKITGKVLLIYIMLRSAYILMYSNYSEVHFGEKTVHGKGLRADTWQFFFF